MLMCMELIARRAIVRAANVAKLREMGFSTVEWFPLREHRAVVRPAEEIAARALGVAAVWAWSALPERELATPALRAHVERSHLRDALLVTEQAYLDGSRGEPGEDSEPLIDTAWTLAWTLGFEPAPDPAGIAIDEPTRALFVRFLVRGGDIAIQQLARGIRSDRDIVETEDLFTCAHQTARLACLGHPEATVPASARFSSIETRRHALSWCLSPDDAWDRVDLST